MTPRSRYEARVLPLRSCSLCEHQAPLGDGDAYCAQGIGPGRMPASPGGFLCRCHGFEYRRAILECEAGELGVLTPMHLITIGVESQNETNWGPEAVS